MRLRLPKATGRGPWAIASFIAIPLFFESLMASTLAQEKPRVVQWQGAHKLITMWHAPTSGTEARIWLWALVPPLLLSLVGYICMRIRYGWYIACAAGIVISLAVVHKLDTWARHHTHRFSIGVDLIPASNLQSNQYNAGEWEKLAHDTALSLSHWTIGLAAVSIVVMVALYIRRRFFSRRPLFADDGAIHEGVHAPDATLPAE